MDLRILAAAALPLCLPLAHAQENQSTELDKVVVSSTRSEMKLEDAPQVVTVINREELERQLARTSDTSQILSNLLPAFSPGRQKLSGAGETFRGRSPLFLIDGIPQSNPLRDAGRDGHTIDLSMVERIEVIHGANAIHGLGATGGIINFITRRPSADQTRQSITTQVTTSVNEPNRETSGYKLGYQISAARDNVDVLLGLSFEDQGVYVDAEDRIVGVDNTQGDLMDSQAVDVFLKMGYWFSDHQNLVFSLNRYQVESNMNYVSVTGDRDQGVPTGSVEGNPVGKAPRNNVLTTSLSYRDDAFYGFNLSAQLYRQDFEGRFGAVTSGTFQDPDIAPVGSLFDQSQTASEKLGAKVSLSKAELLDGTLKITTGLDLLQDTTEQSLVLTGRSWVPETSFNNYAPFVQAEYRPVAPLIMHAGVRHEYAELDVDPFQTLASANAVNVGGGKPDFQETLLNAGLVYKVTPWLSAFANYAQGFGMPDVGRVLRGINQPDQDVDEFRDLQPILTDNQELGLRVARNGIDFELSYYRSDSDLGARLQNIDGFYFVRRERTDISGVEVALAAPVNDAHKLNASYSYISGKYDSDADGSLDARLDGANIPPNRMLLGWQAQWSDRLSTVMQISHAFDRSFDNPELEFDGYSLLDLSASYQLPVGRASLALSNALNEDYFSYYSQSAQINDDRNFTGRGRTLSASYSLDF